jgi:uncharacterized protein (DUF2147 family)
MLSLRNAIVTVVLLLASVPALAANLSPVGTWKTIDDKTGEAKSIVQITEHDGVLEGKILVVLKSDQGPHPICKECDGKRHNQPIEGMNFMWGLTRDDDVWDGGKILDPKTGRVYKAKIQVINGGKNLKVRGYIGFALLGRTQIWHRYKKPEPAAASSAAATP